MVIIEQDPNARFEKAIFNLLRSFNFIDLNVGLLISYISRNDGIDVAYKRLSKMTFDKKMKCFNSLLEKGVLNEHLGEKGVYEFKEWFLQAHEARRLRNRYVHAIWRFNPSMIGKPVSISSPIWMKHILEGETVENMSLLDLEKKASNVEKSFKDFCNLRKKYRI